MALEDILKKIQDDAKNAASEIKTETEKKIAAIKKKAEEQARAAREEIIKEAETRAGLARQKILSNARLDAKKRLLFIRRELVEKVFGEARKAFLELNKEEARELFKQALCEETDSGEETVVISSTEKTRITKEFIEEVNEALRSRGKKGNLVLQILKTEAEDGGFLLKGKKMLSDCTFSSMLSTVREDVEPEIAGILF